MTGFLKMVVAFFFFQALTEAWKGTGALNQINSDGSVLLISYGALSKESSLGWKWAYIFALVGLL